MKNENRSITPSPLPGWGEAGRGAESWHVPDPAGQFASAYVGMGNNPVSLTDLDGMWAVGTYGGYSRMLAAAGRELALMYQDYYDWIDMFSLHKGFLHDVISINYADGKSGMNSTNAIGNQPDEQAGSDDPPKDEKKTNNNQDSNNWTFYSTVWGTLISEAARGNIPGLSMGFSVFGGGLGAWSNGKQAFLEFQAGNYEKGMLEAAQCVAYVGGTVMLFFPATSMAGAWVITIDGGVDIYQFFDN